MKLSLDEAIHWVDWLRMSIAVRFPLGDVVHQVKLFTEVRFPSWIRLSIRQLGDTSLGEVSSPGLDCPLR